MEYSAIGTSRLCLSSFQGELNFFYHGTRGSEFEKMPQRVTRHGPAGWTASIIRTITELKGRQDVSAAMLLTRTRARAAPKSEAPWILGQVTFRLTLVRAQ